MSGGFLLILALIGGLALGLIYFAGLWLTIRQLGEKNKALPLFFISYLLRMLLVIVGFYLIASESWQRLMLALLGFILARFLITRVVTTTGSANDVVTRKEVSHGT